MSMMEEKRPDDMTYEGVVVWWHNLWGSSGLTVKKKLV
jgi:hypothetical protein